jgi:hypothetical protein
MKGILMVTMKKKVQKRRATKKKFKKQDRSR